MKFIIALFVVVETIDFFFLISISILALLLLLVFLIYSIITIFLIVREGIFEIIISFLLSISFCYARK